MDRRVWVPVDEHAKVSPPAVGFQRHCERTALHISVKTRLYLSLSC